MRLNLPIHEQLASCENLLIAGMGGGFDLFCGLPIYFELKEDGHSPHLANLTFTDIRELQDELRLSEHVVGVTGEHQLSTSYAPEIHLARWFNEKLDEDVIIWSLERAGVRPLIETYNTVVEHLDINGILLVDGGVDGLMRGDEAEIGTMVEDSVSLLAVNELKQVPVRIAANLGLGVEWEVSYQHVFENIAALTSMGAFLGTCSLVQEMTPYQLYEDALLFVQDQSTQKPSVINSSVVSAVRGKFGDYHLTERTRGSKLLITPLMSIYWFFDLRAVARRNLFASDLRWTDTLREAFVAVTRARRTVSKRPTG